MAIYSYICLAFLAASVNLNLAEATPCNEIPSLALELEWFATTNYFKVYYTNWNVFKCANVALVNATANADGSHTSLAIIWRQDRKYDFRTTLVGDRKEWKATLCQTGFTNVYRNVYANFQGDNKAFCVMTCEKEDPTKSLLTICLGVTENDKQLMYNFLKENDVTNVQDAEEGCEPLQCAETDVEFTNN
ncbi:hypothetical protein CHUAL_005114 [Chamberlinius hualienensis]